MAYYYNQCVSQKFDYVLNESFEEFLLANDAEKPSDLFDSVETLDAEYLLFFRDICIPDIMDFLSCFRNTNDLRAERIRVLDFLLEKGALSSDVRMREVEDIVGRVIVDAGASDFNGPKIYVDDASIKKKYFGEVSSLLIYFKQTLETSDDRFTIIGDEYNSAGLIEGYLSGNKNSTVLKIFGLLSDAFKYDEKFGLDKNLSAEIRHGFFSNLMRARLEERKLITETDDGGNYQRNVYWREANRLVSDDLWDRIEEDLKRFNKAFNKLVSDAEEWMKIQNNSEEGARLFIFRLTKIEFDRIKTEVAGGTAETVSDEILKLMWDKTDNSLSLIRDSLNVDFRNKVDRLFDNLEQDIRITKRGLALIELISAIGAARNEIKEDITTVAEWFNRTRNEQIKAGSLSNVLEIAISSFERMKGGAFAIQKNVPFDLPNIEISATAVKPFVIAIINLLDNCYRHSGLGHATRVEISGSNTTCGASIMIRNDLSDDKVESMSPEFLAGIEAKILNAESGNLIMSEGGSGLVKAYNAIAPFGSSSSVTVSLDEGQFFAEIRYEP